MKIVIKIDYRHCLVEINFYLIKFLSFVKKFEINERKKNITTFISIFYNVTKYCIVKAIPDFTADTAAKFLFEEIICKFGFPIGFISIHVYLFNYAPFVVLAKQIPNFIIHQVMV